MKLPETVKVGPFTYRVEDYTWAPDDDQIGGCDTLKLVISIDIKAPVMSVKNTLLHEIMHAIYHLYDLESCDGEEDVVMRMANGMQMVMVDNPRLGKYLW